MTIPIAVADLAATLRSFGSAILVAKPPRAWPCVLTVDPHVEDHDVVVPGAGGPDRPEY